MLGLPLKTECSRQLPKKAIYAKFNMDNAARDRFDTQVSRIIIVNEVTPHTTTLLAGERINGFYVLQVSLKRKSYDARVIAQMPRLIEQNMVLLLDTGNEKQVAVLYGGRLICSPWYSGTEPTLSLKGLNFDTVWEDIVAQIGDIQVEQGNTLEEQIAINAKREQIAKEIDRLEKLAWKEVQPKKKLELVRKITALKKEAYSI